MIIHSITFTAPGILDNRTYQLVVPQNTTLHEKNQLEYGTLMTPLE